ncbi:ribonuclease [Nocardioides alcanivorans]|uniref:ribonuclease n=1 Tax=Nocardioides alcanivorans TaxID=2897352 RepID=UPI001F3210FC|nr:ribonuclease [Nocardioides alcanivorans]
MTLDKRTLRAISTVLVALVAVVVWWFQAGSDEADKGPDPSAVVEVDTESGLGLVSVDSLPAQAEDTLDLIDAGGPFPHDRDGVVFGNYEGILPQKQRGHYHEYTVPTPGLSHRGARRIVTGDDGEYYWTPDHYATFLRIDR